MPNVSNNNNLLQDTENSTKEDENIGFGNRIGQQHYIEKLNKRHRGYQISKTQLNLKQVKSVFGEP